MLANSAFPQLLSQIFMQINRILTKLHQLKLRGGVIMPHRVHKFEFHHHSSSSFLACNSRLRSHMSTSSSTQGGSEPNLKDKNYYSIKLEQTTLLEANTLAL